MQTFLPYESFIESARVLDNKRLGKQRVEVLQILNAINDPSRGWQRHPAVLMWKYHKHALGMYGVIVCKEWKQRGFKDTCEAKIRNAAWGGECPPVEPGYPLWLGTQRFHRSHQSNLLRKDADWYGQFFDVRSDLPYYWPVQGDVILDDDEEDRPQVQALRLRRRR